MALTAPKVGLREKLLWKTEVKTQAVLRVDCWVLSNARLKQNESPGNAASGQNPPKASWILMWGPERRKLITRDRRVCNQTGLAMTQEYHANMKLEEKIFISTQHTKPYRRETQTALCAAVLWYNCSLFVLTVGKLLTLCWTFSESPCLGPLARHLFPLLCWKWYLGEA